MGIVEDIKFPTTDDSWIKKVVIGGILGIIPILNFLVIGYYLRVIKGGTESSSGMPEWDEWGNLFVKGIVAVIIAFIYMLIPLIVMFASVGTAVQAAIAAGDISAINIGAAVGGLAAGGLLMLLAILLEPMALVLYAKEGSFGAAFRIGEIIKRIVSKLGSYILVYIVVFVLAILVGIINIIPILGWIIAIIANFYIMVVAFNMFGKVYAESRA